MQLQTLIIFSKEHHTDSNFPFYPELEKHGINIHLNPSYDDFFFPNSSIDNALVVSDNMQGCQFALKHNIPFIQKWNENENLFPHKPVCYYDNIELLDYKYFINQWKRAHHLPLTIAKTKRLSLKELTMDDIPILYQLRMAPSISQTLPALDSLEQELDKHEHYIPCQYEFFDYGLWGIYLSDGTLIGQAGIENTEYRNETILELSYFIHPKYQRKGYATEAILAIYQYITESLELNRAITIIAKNNLPSIRTAMNLGMKKEETVQYYGFDCNYYVIDNIHDFLILYDSEQKRVRSAQSVLKKAERNPVQQVYSKYHP